MMEACGQFTPQSPKAARRQAGWLDMPPLHADGVRHEHVKVEVDDGHRATGTKAPRSTDHSASLLGF